MYAGRLPWQVAVPLADRKDKRMYTRILVPLDGSPRAERSVPVAAMLARATGGSVVLVQILGVLGTIGAFGTIEPTNYNPELLEEDRREATAYLTGIAGRPVLAGISTETGVFTGSPATAILDAITAYKADAIIITSHGRAGMTRWALGSVAEYIVRHTKVPVIVLRARGNSPAEQPSDAQPPARVLVPLDGSPLAEAVLKPAVELAKALNAPRAGLLHLMLVVSPYETAEAHLDIEGATATAREYLAAVAAQLQAGYEAVTVTWDVSVNVDIASGVMRDAEQGDGSHGDGASAGCDVIAMATHGRTGLKRWMVGSITERVLHATAQPMLIVRPGLVEAKQQVQERVETTERTSPEAPVWSALF